MFLFLSVLIQAHSCKYLFLENCDSLMSCEVWLTAECLIDSWQRLGSERWTEPDYLKKSLDLLITWRRLKQFCLLCFQSGRSNHTWWFECLAPPPLDRAQLWFCSLWSLELPDVPTTEGGGNPHIPAAASLFHTRLLFTANLQTAGLPVPAGLTCQNTWASIRPQVF